MEFVDILEKCIGKKARIKFVKFQPGDVKSTFADMTEFKQLTGLSSALLWTLGCKNLCPGTQVTLNS